MSPMYKNTPAESQAVLQELLLLGGRDVFKPQMTKGSPYPGAISNRECLQLLKFAAGRRRMKKAHETPGKRCWKGCVYPHE